VIANPPGACDALALLSNGNILVVAGQAVAEYTSKGSVLPAVSAAKIVATEPASAFNVFQPDGNYLYAFDLFVGEESRGHDSSVEVLRFTETGTPDPTFADPSFHFIPPWRTRNPSRGPGAGGCSEWRHCRSGQPNTFYHARSDHL